ncbi:hypothetical protein DAPPUDRAFT_265806 [Daphnia pulex]|uniref:Uncharacterized protein n=1 Tax=Daphnia pulex TaxID=6669 RepID=E9HU06_DAPPU|nr:hypothetical protein DAPPUDRAFT_265806 [Daphnia pulex]|eukprot:EFX64774.1 hypothetical protein DAPPUDRAFT_265806 [Daphnia pulex]
MEAAGSAVSVNTGKPFQIMRREERITEAATPMELCVLGDDAKKERGLPTNS